MVTKMAELFIKEVKGFNADLSKEKVNWVDIKGYRTMFKAQKDKTVREFEMELVRQK